MMSQAITFRIQAVIISTIPFDFNDFSTTLATTSANTAAKERAENGPSGLGRPCTIKIQLTCHSLPGKSRFIC